MVYNCKKLFPFLDTSNSQILQIQLNLREPTVPYFIGHLRAHTGLPWPLSSYTRSRPARKDATNRNLLRQKLYCLHLQEQESKRENGETPSLLRRIILRLGRITPWLATAHRPSCRHGEGRAHGVENYPWHMRRLFVYHLEHRISAPSCNGECEGGFLQVLSGRLPTGWWWASRIDLQGMDSL